jgi:hypothetical protein
MEKVLLYIDLTKVTYNIRLALLLKLGPGILFTMHQLLKLTIWLLNIEAKGEYGNRAEFLCSHASL